MLLVIDTSTRYAGVALADAGRVISCRSWYSAVNHTAELMPAVAQTLESAGLTVNDLDGIAVALGPGGFSALRVGMSVAKGLAMAAGKPLVGVGTLDSEAQPYLESGLPVCALLDAGRSEVASAYFGTDGQRSRDDLISSPEELLAEIAELTLFCGEGAPPHTALMREMLGSNAVPVGHAPASRLWSLAELGRRRLEAGEADDLATLQPYYLRMPTIGGPKRRDRVPQQS
jgi:tRNA threonylcarbamoyladenosine biosynthesis protein TsaB